MSESPAGLPEPAPGVPASAPPALAMRGLYKRFGATIAVAGAEGVHDQPGRCGDRDPPEESRLAVRRRAVQVVHRAGSGGPGNEGRAASGDPAQHIVGRVDPPPAEEGRQHEVGRDDRQLDRVCLLYTSPSPRD